MRSAQARQYHMDNAHPERILCKSPHARLANEPGCMMQLPHIETSTAFGHKLKERRKHLISSNFEFANIGKFCYNCVG